MAQRRSAKDYAFLLLKYRARSESEIRQRLKKKKFDPKTIEETVSFLKEKDFINDAYFAKTWMESRLKKPFGIRRIKEELKLKGINPEIIKSQIDELTDTYCEEEVVQKLAQEKFAKLKNIEPEKAKRRLFNYLLRRGFSLDIVMDVLNKLSI